VLSGVVASQATEIAEIKGTFKKFSESAKKDIDNLYARGYGAAAKELGGHRLFYNDDDDHDKKKSAEPTQELVSIADKSSKYVHKQFESLLSMSSSASLLENHRRIWEAWRQNNPCVKKADDIHLDGPEFARTFYLTNNTVDLVSLESFGRLVKELEVLEAVVVMPYSPPTEQESSQVFLHEPEGAIFLTDHILPVAFGVEYQYLVTVDDEEQVQLLFASFNAASQSLSAVLRLAAKTKGPSKEIEVTTGFADMNRNGKPIDLIFPELQLDDRLSLLEFDRVKLSGSMPSVPLCASTLKLKRSEILSECAMALADTIRSVGNSPFTLEVHEEVSISESAFLGLLPLLSNSDCNFTLHLKNGAWNELPCNVSKEFTKQIGVSMETGGKLRLLLDSDDVMKGPLAALKGLVGTNHHVALQKIASHGARELPFQVDVLRQSLDNQVQEWARTLGDVVADSPALGASSGSAERRSKRQKMDN